MRRWIARRLREVGLIGVADDIWAQLERVRSYPAQRRFKRRAPDFALPPFALAYDAYGGWDPERYYQQGQEHAATIASIIKMYRPAAQVICEWGCGPMRVLRHMSRHFPPPAQLIGLDYNERTIRWCKERFGAITFLKNDLAPPLPLNNASVDAIYAISVFTHLAEENHYAYVADLMRCLKPGGILVVTLHGDRFLPKLSAEEQANYANGGLVVRGRTKEGKRTFAAFQSPVFVRERLFKGLDIVLHDPNHQLPGFSQDLWVVRRQEG